MQKTIKLKNSRNIKRDIEKLIQSLGGIKKFINKNEKVLIKPSCNSPHTFPATTDIKVIETVIEILQQQTKNITIGDSSGVLYKPSKKVFDFMGLTKLSKNMKIPLIDLDKQGWIEKTNKNAKYLKKVKLTKALDKFDKIIFLPTLRTHRGSRFTMSLKLGMGFVKVEDRLKMHEDKLEEKIAELNLYFKPNLIILDGRKCFITDGPEKGKLRKPKVLFASENRLDIDIQGIKTLKQYKTLTSRLNLPINQLPLIKHSKKININ